MARGKATRRAGVRLLDSIWAKAAAGLVLWAGGHSLGNPVLAQTPERTEIVQYHLNKQTIQLPIQLDEQFRPILQKIRLYAKEQPAAPWTLRDEAAPNQAAFTFKAAHDGEYWFMMVTVDREGRCAPQDITKEPPAMAVVVDTQPPQVEVALLNSGAEGHLLQCLVRDVHVDATRTRVQYQTMDKVFRDLERVPDRANLYCIPAQANITGQVRVTGADQAGNTVTRDYNLGQLALAAKTPAAPRQQTPVAPAAPVTPVAGSQSLQGPQMHLPPASAVTKAGTPAATTTMPPAEKSTPKLLPDGLGGSPTLSTNPAVNVPQGPPLSTGPITTLPDVPIRTTAANEPVTGPKLEPASPKTPTPPVPAATKTITQASPAATQPPTIAPKKEGAQVHHLLVNSTRVFLEYRIEQAGPSGVGRVEVWCTRDKGQTWQRIAEDRDGKSPAEVQLPGDGVYGLTLVVSNGLGFGAQPPAAGDAPDWWIEVDATQPVAQITTVRLSTEDPPAVHVGWTSRDRNLGSGPVELLYAVKRTGPWLPIAKGLKAEGQFRWVPPADIGAQAFFRLAVRDLAGNTAITETTQPVALDDLSRPRARIAGITTEAGTTPVSAPPSVGQ